MQVTRRQLPAVLVIVAVVVSCFPLLQGFPRGHDWIFELVRVTEYGHALGAGQYPPFWADNLYGGYGSPIFLFYAPQFMLVASVFSEVTLQLHPPTIRITGIAASLLGMLLWIAGMFFKRGRA